jgi:toxin-antitoxin system PIN domain toxin
VIIPDVNMLLYAEIDAYPHHETARVWWEDALSSDIRVALPSIAIFGFLRISTNRRIFEEPLSLHDALGRVETWLARNNVSFLGPGPRHLETAFALLRTLGTGGNLTTDVQLAAHAIENQAELCSNDLDFGRFPGLRWTNPLAAR